MVNKFTRDIKSAILKLVTSLGVVEKITENERLLPFLMEVWNLEEMPSSDGRYKSKDGEIIQHYRNNDDWSTYQLLVTELRFFDLSDDDVQKFLISILNGDNYKADDIELYDNLRYQLENIIDEIGFELQEKNNSSISGLPIIQILKKNNNNFRSRSENQIPFYVSSQISSGKNISNYLDEIDVAPCFQLVADSWDDYGYRTSFTLFFKNTQGQRFVNIGNLKIISKFSFLDDSGFPDEHHYVKDDLPVNGFTELDHKKFCSVGCDIDYYKQLKNEIGGLWKTVLKALCDASFFSILRDNFENTRQWKISIERTELNDCAKMLSEAKNIIEGKNVENPYDFTYKFKPLYSTNEVDVNFTFNLKSIFAHRLKAIIGKNGCGKTQLLSAIPKSFGNNEIVKFDNILPSFQKVITLSSSYFDNFEIPDANFDFNYIYCGLSKKVNGEKKISSIDDQIDKIKKCSEEIENRKRENIFGEIMKDLIPNSIFDLIFYQDERSDFYKIKTEKIESAFRMMSSGESILFYLLIQLISSIRPSSLLLIDEPETHLHPNAISILIGHIYDILEKFNSFAILATHSPLVIREVLAQDVYIAERIENDFIIRPIAEQSFGANLTALISDVFGNIQNNCYHRAKIKTLIDEYSEDQIMKELCEGDLCPSIGLTSFINVLERRKNEKN